MTLLRGVAALWHVRRVSLASGLDEFIAMVVLSISLTLTPPWC